MKKGKNSPKIITIIIDKIECGQINLDMANNGIKIGKYPKSNNKVLQNNKQKDKNNCC